MVLLTAARLRGRFADNMRDPKHSRGFSLIELVVALAIMLAIMAVSVPSFLRAIKTYRLGSTATDVANILQRARYEAIKQNATNGISCCPAPVGNTIAAYIDLNNNGRMDPTEPRVLLPSDIRFVGAPPAPGPASMGPAYAAAGPPPGFIRFDARGALFPPPPPPACVLFPPGGGPAVYVLYLGYPQDASYGYRAITVTPSGKTKVWRAQAGGPWQ